MKKVIVIGGGPAGMISAIQASKNFNKVILIEKNEKLGKKLYITGKGRCNLSNNSVGEDFIKNIISNPKFLYASISKFSSQDTLSFFENNGLKLKVERGNRIFPESDKASDVTKTFTKLLTENNVEIMLNTSVKELLIEDGVVKGVKTESQSIYADSVICATGGISYPLTGSTGDGYTFAKRSGHTVVDLKPALVGLEIEQGFCKEMQGLSLKNVVLTAKRNNKTIYSELGEMLFTHFGVSGPLVLSCSSYINRLPLNEVSLSIDLKPALDEQTLDQRLIRELKENNVKSISNVMPSLLPKSMVLPILSVAKVKQNKICAEITQLERKSIVTALKNLNLTIKKLRPIDEAIVTSGGVSVNNVNPKTMESKIIKGLFFAGEVLDVDALTGGYNIQIALSTGFVAGTNA